jgi:hypothetical protein
MAQSPDRLRKVFGNVVPCPAEQAAENRPSLTDFSVFSGVLAGIRSLLSPR